MTSFATRLLSDPAIGTDAWKPLRRWLRLDAAVTGVNALAYLAAAPLLSGVLGPQPASLRGAGAFLAGCTIVVLLVAGRARPGRSASAAVIAVNLAWTAGSLVVAATGVTELTGLGRTWVVAQALVVAGFAVAQTVALRRTPR